MLAVGVGVVDILGTRYCQTSRQASCRLANGPDAPESWALVGVRLAFVEEQIAGSEALESAWRGVAAVLSVAVWLSRRI
jgi:hypothetical protein